MSPISLKPTFGGFSAHKPHFNQSGSPTLQPHGIHASPYPDALSTHKSFHALTFWNMHFLFPPTPISFIPFDNLCNKGLRLFLKGWQNLYITMLRTGTLLFWKCEQNLVPSVQFLSLVYYVFKFLSFYLGSQCNVTRDHPRNRLIVLECSCLFLLSCFLHGRCWVL